jgi:hypothetical protein
MTKDRGLCSCEQVKQGIHIIPRQRLAGGSRRIRARMLAALDREQDREALRVLRRLVELDRELSRGHSLGR